jgi:sulfur-carrier protein
MSVQVQVPTVLRKHTNGARAVEVDGANVAAVIESLETHYPGMRSELLSDDGTVRQFVNIYVNDEDIRYLDRLNTALTDGDRVAILPAVAGG